MDFFTRFSCAAWACGLGIFLPPVLFGLFHATQLGLAWGPILIIFLVGVALTVVRAVSRR